MKTKLFSLCILLTLSLPIQSQTTYDYLSRPGLIMASLHSNWVDGTRNNTYKFAGDTLLCGENLLMYQPISLNFYTTLLRIDGGKVWMKYSCDDEWLIYDFDLEIGDTFNNREVVDINTTTLLNGEERKRLILSSSNGTTIEWVDGIGDLKWGLFPIADFEGQTSLICVKENNEAIWLNPDQSAELCDSISCPVPRPDFDFEVDIFQVNFENLSYNHSSVQWDFGDGNTSTELHPNHTYENPGCYNVNLTLGTDCLSSTFKKQLSVPVCIAQEWQVNTPDLTTGSFKVNFVTESLGWAIDLNQIWKTEDGGMNWTEQFYPIPPPPVNRQLATIDMADEMNGVIALANFSAPTSIAAFLVTNDGGLTWEEKMPGSYFVSSAIMTDDGQVFASGQYDGVFYSNDWGNTFVELPIDGIDLSRFQYLGNNEVVAMGLQGIPPWATRSISFSDDSGQSWTHNLIPDEYYFAWGFHFFNPNEGFICGGLHEGFIAKTEDGGQSWQEIPYDDERRPTSIYFVDEQTGWVIGRDGLVLSTTDGGNTWLVGNCGYRHNLISISALDSENCWLGSGYGKYLELDPNAVDCTMVNIHHPNLGDNHLLIFPNPASESVTISLSESNVANENNRIAIYNNLGQNIFEDNISDETMSINTKTWSPGIYFIQWFRNEQLAGIEKLIVLD